jgi:hypothetical protein
MGNSGSDKCPDSITTNRFPPTLVSNWWTAEGCGISTNGAGLNTSQLSPKNCGELTIIFNQKWKHTCNANTEISSVTGTVIAASVEVKATSYAHRICNPPIIQFLLH